MERRSRPPSATIARGELTCWCTCSTCRGRRGEGGPEDRRTGGPKDRRTGGPEDRRTGGPEDRRTGGPKDRKCEGHTERGSVCPFGHPVIRSTGHPLLAVPLGRAVEEGLVLRHGAQDLLRRFGAERATLRHVRAHHRQHVLAELRVGARLGVREPRAELLQHR